MNRSRNTGDRVENKVAFLLRHHVFMSVENINTFAVRTADWSFLRHSISNYKMLLMNTLNGMSVLGTGKCSCDFSRGSAVHGELDEGPSTWNKKSICGCHRRASILFLCVWQCTGVDYLYVPSSKNIVAEFLLKSFNGLVQNIESICS